MGRRVTLADRTGESVLLIPRACERRGCPLVVVSHGRQASARSELGDPVLKRFFDHLGSRGYVLLLSGDAGPESWGNQAALTSIRRAFKRAKTQFQWDGRPYTLGISMGGLCATLTAYRLTLAVPVKAVALIAGRVNLADAHCGPPERTAALERAYGATGEAFWRAVRYHDPVQDFADFEGNTTPVLAVASPEDTAVNSAVNGQWLVQLGRLAGAPSQSLTVSGCHLGPEHLGAGVAKRIEHFFANHA